MSDAHSSRKSGPRKSGGDSGSGPASTAYDVLEGRLGYTLERALLVRALTHRSWLSERGSPLPENGDNEQLEFLGDSVLGFVVSEALIRRHGLAREGQLSQWKAQLVSSAVASREDPGALRVLRAYERWRKSEVAGMAQAIDAFDRLLAHGAGPVARLAQRGLSWVNRSQELRRFFIRRALGLSGELPDAAR